MCIYIGKKEHFERVGCRMLCNHYYSNIIYCPILSVIWRINHYIYICTQFTHLAYVSCIII